MAIPPVINDRESNIIPAGKIYVWWIKLYSYRSPLDNNQNDKRSNALDVENIKSLVKPNHSLFVAKFDYLSRTEEELSFVKEEILYIIDTDDEDWCLARNASDDEGYIPSNHGVLLGSLKLNE